MADQGFCEFIWCDAHLADLKFRLYRFLRVALLIKSRAIYLGKLPKFLLLVPCQCDSMISIKTVSVGEGLPPLSLARTLSLIDEAPVVE
jgi:hypothetical protein